jgi:8-oxo-dGTP pyrophosphatase MutT (NUDIX family)
MPESEAAVAIVRTRGPEDTILFIRRAERVGDPWSGPWSFPGGRRDPGDETLLETDHHSRLIEGRSGKNSFFTHR